MKRVSFISYILIAILLFGCEDRRSFEWEPEIEALTNRDLKGWLKKAPFKGEWNARENNEDAYVITNVEQVFPFLGKFKNEDDDFTNSLLNGGDLFQKETVIFKDADWGELFVCAVLIYEPQELYVSRYNSEMGNVAFSGADAINESYSANLSETMLFEKNDIYKTAIYKVSSNYKKYLSGFYQSGKLVFQFGIPYTDEEKGIKKIKEINTALELNIPEWSDMTVESLQVNTEPVSFWKNPYYGMYSEPFIPELKVKILNTNFERLKDRIAAEKQVDYAFNYTNEKGEHWLSFLRGKDPVDKEAYEKERKEKPFFVIKNDNGKVYYEERQTDDGYIIMEAETLLKDDKLVQIEAKYPVTSSEAREQVEDMLTTLRVRRF